MIKENKIFITGGSGFIATNLIKRIITNNKIVVYDNFSRNSLKGSGYEDHPNIKLIKGDVLDYCRIKSSIPKDTDIVIHMAAIAGIDTVIKNPVMTMEVNMIGTYNVLKAINELGMNNTLKRFLDFSTSEVFGINAFRVDEKCATNLQPVGEARWTYAVSKLAAEHLVHGYHKQYGLKSVTIRPFNIYGPGQTGEGAIHHFVVKAVRKEPLMIHGDGDQIRSWCYIDDMVEGIILCLTRKEAVGEVFNIGNTRGTITILGLAEKVVHLSGGFSKITHVPKNYVDVELRIPNIDKSIKLLGYRSQVDLNEGLEKTIKWYRDKFGL